jgi:hypothetical protein
MQTLDEWKAILSTDLLALRRLQEGEALSRMRRAMKQQEIGQHCCQAGESLSDADLFLLKQALGLDKEAWQSFKAKVRPDPE